MDFGLTSARRSNGLLTREEAKQIRIKMKVR